jgi:tetratricopeptide (TPR) repeat protein
MNIPTRTIRRDTRVFISAVTRELGSVRKLVKKGLEDNDYHAVEQDNFPPDYRDLKDKLRERINSCDAVVHIPGHCYGAEPEQRPADAPRRSYTQLEYDTAVELGKPVYVFLTGADFPADPHELEPPELQELQKAHRQRLTSTGQDYNPTDSPQHLDQKIRSLQLKVGRLTDELQQVDQKVAVHGGRLRRWLVALAVFSLAGLGTLGYVGWRQERERAKQERERIAEEAARRDVNTNLTSMSTKLEEVRNQFADPEVLTGKIKSHIRKRADEEIASARAKVPYDWRKRDEIEKRRDQALGRVEDLVETIRNGLAGKPDPIFVEAAEILDRQGVDEAIKYLEQKRQTIEKNISARKSSRDQEEALLREAYRPKVLQADLYEANLKWDKALEIREEVAEENSRWFDAQTALGNLLWQLARYGEAEPHLQEAVKRAANPGEKATGFNNLARLLQARNRLAEAEPLHRRALEIDERSLGPDHPDVARDLNNLAELFRVTDRVEEAEPLYHRALAIDEHSHGPDHPDVAIRLNNLALLFHVKHRLEAEPFYRRALAIDERSYGPQHPAVAREFNNLGSWLEATNRLKEAEPLYRRALAIDEQSYGPDHPDVARDLNNLAGLLRGTNRVAEAEPLYRRAMVITEQTYGPEHPNVANALNNLAELLRTTNRVAEAEPLHRRALAIFERSYGPEHPDVAKVINNLALLLQATNRVAEAEPLFRRALTIGERSFGPDHPTVANGLNNLAELLRTTNRVAEAESLFRRALAIDERSYGPDHPSVASNLNNLAALLYNTNRVAVAVPLMARAVSIFFRFQRSTGHEHPQLQGAMNNYRGLLSMLNPAEPEIEARIKALREGSDKFSPIVPEVERLLGPVKPVADVLTSLDRQYEEQGKPAAYFLKPNEPIAPHLDELLRPDGDGLSAQGLAAFFGGVHANAVVLYEAALELMADQPAQAPARFLTRINRAVALRELGLVAQARDDLVRLLPELDQVPATYSVMKGRARYHLALCQWRLGDRASAQRSAEESLAAYDGVPKANPVNPAIRRQSEDLLAAVKAGKAPLPLAAIDAPAALEAARARYRAREALTKGPGKNKVVNFSGEAREASIQRKQY